MKTWFAALLLFISLPCFAQKKAPLPIIFDTDIAPDYDDVGALALLHAFADKGEAKILATISSNAFKTTAPTLSVINTYFNKPSIPIGITKSATPNKSCSQQWAEAIIQKYPHTLRTNGEALEAVELYRKILSAATDKSVTIVTVGFFTNLANLLASRPDAYSALGGRELVGKKVYQLVSMATRLDKDSTSGYEFNVLVDPAASKKVFKEWPTPILLSGFDIGIKIQTGIRLINNDSIRNSPIQDAFRIALAKDKNTAGRYSWDETAVFVAVRGYAPYFSVRRLNFDIEQDGKNVLIPGDRLGFLEFIQRPSEIGLVIEDLMMHQPVSKSK